jgi:hypothetical protein
MSSSQSESGSLPSDVWWTAVDRGGDDLKKALSVLVAQSQPIGRSKSRKGMLLIEAKLEMTWLNLALCCRYTATRPNDLTVTNTKLSTLQSS